MRSAWRNASPYLLLTLTAFFWASNAVLARAIHHLLPPVAMAFWRWTLAALLLLPFVLGPIYRQRALLRANWGLLVLLSVFGVSAYNTLLYSALQTTTATNGVLINSVTPLMIVFSSWLVFGNRLGRRQQAGIALALLGMTVIVARGDPAVLAQLDFNRGDFLLVVGAIAWTLYTVCLRRRPAAIDPAALLGTTVMLGAALLLPAYLVEAAGSREAVWNAVTFASLGYFAVFPSILAYLFWNRGVEQIGANRAGLFLYLIPLFGVALAILFLGERLHAFHVAGAALIFSGVYLASVRTVTPQ